MKTKIIELIYTEERRGLGEEDDPVRLIKQLYTKDGKQVAEHDPLEDHSWFDSSVINS